MSDHAAPAADGLQITEVEDASDFTGMFDCIAAAFGTAINDGIWTAIHPGWDTPEGRAAGAARMVKRWQATTRDSSGRPNTVFLKATLPADPQQQQQQQGGGRIIVGAAIWAQLSAVPGRGVAPSAVLGSPTELAAMYEGCGDAALQRVASQVWASLMAPRVALVREKEAVDPPAVFALDLCAVDPGFWRRGIAQRLAQWGLDEAERRGGLEAITEASVMGRHVYRKIGFKPVAEIPYEVDAELLHGRQLPSNLFMRTGA